MAGPRCQSIWGHKFEPRYSFTVPNMEFREGKQSVPMGDPGAAELIMRRHQHKTYHGDVCVRCGATVNRSPQAVSENGNVQGGSAT